MKCVRLPRLQLSHRDHSTDQHKSSALIVTNHSTAVTRCSSGRSPGRDGETKLIRIMSMVIHARVATADSHCHVCHSHRQRSHYRHYRGSRPRHPRPRHPRPSRPPRSRPPHREPAEPLWISRVRLADSKRRGPHCTSGRRAAMANAADKLPQY